jgi:hypothetical protein
VRPDERLERPVEVDRQAGGKIRVGRASRVHR